MRNRTTTIESHRRRGSWHQSLIHWIGASACVCMLYAVAAMAQTTTGSIYGTITDSSGAVIPGATVAVTNVETNEVVSTKSNGIGDYIFPVLNPGSFKVTGHDDWIQDHDRVGPSTGRKPELKRQLFDGARSSDGRGYCAIVTHSSSILVNRRLGRRSI